MTTPVYSSRIKHLREQRLWPQEQLAAIAGVNVRTIQRIEAGGIASADTLKALANAFRIDVDVLVSEFKAEDLPKDLHFLERVTSGTALVQLISGSQAVQFANDDLASQEQIDAVGELLDLIKDWGDILSEVPPSRHLEIAADFTERLEQMAQLGLWLFHTRTKLRVGAGDRQCLLHSSCYYVAKHDNPTVAHLSPDRPVLPVRIPAPTGFA